MNSGVDDQKEDWVGGELEKLHVETGIERVACQAAVDQYLQDSLASKLPELRNSATRSIIGTELLRHTLDMLSMFRNDQGRVDMALLTAMTSKLPATNLLIPVLRSSASYDNKVWDSSAPQHIKEGALVGAFRAVVSRAPFPGPGPRR